MPKSEKTSEEKELTEVIFSWRFPEYVQYHKNIWWYVISLVILAALVVWQIMVNDVTFAIFLVLFYLITLLYENRSPEMLLFAITPDGVKVGKNFHFYREFSHFYVIYQEQGVKNLYLEFRNVLRGRIIVPLDGQNAVAVREYLLNYLREDLDRESEPASEQLRRWLRL